VGLILNVAVIVLAASVIGSLALLAWTFGVSAVDATRRGREQVAASRQSVADAEARLRSATERATGTLAELATRTRPSGGDRFDR
jgi:hypothetical protein